jgi:hypothetical protein
MELLENAVDALKAGREPSLEDLTSQQTEVELRMPSCCLTISSRRIPACRSISALPAPKTNRIWRRSKSS